MTEDFLYYVWQYKTYKQPLLTTEGQEIVVVDAGFRNDNSGPDFSSAKLKIGNTIWSGDVEMHIKSSDWMRHGHQDDASYDSVILHVVYEHDIEISTVGGNHLEVFELKGRLEDGQYARYKSLIGSRNWISCSSQINSINDLKLYSWLDRLLIERLERKTDLIEDLLLQNKNNWEQAFYISLARNFGFKVNADAFEQLAKNTPIEVLARYKDNLFQLEALLFGQSSLINPRIKDEYATQLQNEYLFLKKKHNLIHVHSYQWKFMRMRPVNFPSVRIAQFAQLVHKSSHLLSVVISTDKLKDLYDFFDLEVSDYWNEHYVFGKKTKFRKKKFGKSSFDLLLINTIVPFLFVYANHHGDEGLKEKAIMFLHHTKAESNSIISRFAKEEIHAHNASHSQALLQLKNEYCTYQKCLQCGIGLQLVKGM